MGVVSLLRRILLPHDYTIGGIPVLYDNKYYPNSNGKIDSYTADSNYFIAGPFDTGSTDAKTVTFMRMPYVDHSYDLRFFGDLTATSADYWQVNTSDTPTPRTVNMVGRYMCITINKAYAANAYAYYTINGENHYMFKGKNVT